MSAVIAASANTSAATLYWDANGPASGAGATPNGTWGVNPFWTTDINGLITPNILTTTSDDFLGIPATGTTSGPFTLTVSGTQNAQSLYFYSGQAAISGGTIALGASTAFFNYTICDTGPAGNATLTSNISGNAAQMFWANTGKTLTFSGGTYTRGTGSTMVFRGPGKVISTMANLSSNNAAGIMGAWAYYSADSSGSVIRYAVYSASGIGSLIGSAAAAPANVIGSDGLANYDLGSGTGSIPASTTINTLRFSGTTANTTLAGAFSANGILHAGTGSWVIQSSPITIGSTRELYATTANTNSAIQFASPIQDNAAGPSSLVISGASEIYMLASSTYTGNTLIGGGGALYFGNNGTTGAISPLSNIVNNGFLQTNRSNTVVQGIDFGKTISGVGSTNVNAGTLVLNGSNTFSGKVSVNAGAALSVSGFNSIVGGASSSPLGVPNSATGTIQMNSYDTLNSRLIYTGNGETTDRPITLTGSAGTTFIEHNGSGLLKFTGSITPPSNVSGFPTLTFQGAATAGSGEVVGSISDASSSRSQLTVTKGGSTTWTLSGANQYTGQTLVSGGTLKVGNAAALGFGGIQTTAAANTTVTPGTTLDLNGTASVNEPIVLSGAGVSGSGALVNNNTSAPASVGSGIAAAQLSTPVGSNFSTVPTVSATDAGSGATAVASLGLTSQSFSISPGTTRYSSPPFVILFNSDSTTTSATAVANLNANGNVSGITIVSPGYGVSASAANIAFFGGTVIQTGIAPSGTGNTTHYCASALAMTTPGTNYSSAPAWTVNGIAATVTTTLSSITLAADSSIGGNGDITIDPPIVEAGGARALTKVGGGALTLRGACSYTGGTVVSGGKLVLNNAAGSAIGTGNISVLGTSTLAGTGSFTGAVTLASGSTISPADNSVGTLSTGSLTLQAGATYSVNVDTTANTADRLKVTGAVSLAGNLSLIIPGGRGGAYTPVMVLIDNDGTDPVSGQFSGTSPQSSVFSGLVYSIVYNYDAATSTPGIGNDVAVVFTSLPEPATCLPMLAFGTWNVLRRRRRLTASCS